MLNGRKARHARFRYCPYGCCGPYASRAQQTRIMRRTEARAWRREEWA
jgi:hypothetical protein